MTRKEWTPELEADTRAAFHKLIALYVRWYGRKRTAELLEEMATSITAAVPWSHIPVGDPPLEST